MAAVALTVASLVTRAAPAEPDTAAGQEFMAAMQRVRQHAPEPPDSPALEAYVLHDYLVAARLRRDVQSNPNDALDTTVDEFLKAHGAQPVARPCAANGWQALPIVNAGTGSYPAPSM
jgi:hypothetical protein